MCASYQTLMKTCITYLARREYTRAELEQKTQTYPEVLRHQVLDELTEKGLQSDERFAQMWIRSRINQGKGPLLIRKELEAKGVTKSVINEALSEIAEPHWWDLCRSVYQKKYKDTFVDAKEAQKRLRFLQSRGFPYALIQEILSESSWDEDLR